MLYYIVFLLFQRVEVGVFLFQVFSIDPRVQRLPSSSDQELVRGCVERPGLVDVAVQPLLDRSELAPPYEILDVGDVHLDLLEQLRGDHSAKGVRGEIAECAQAPLHKKNII